MSEADARKEADEVGKGAYRQAGPKTGRQAAKTRQARADPEQIIALGFEAS